MRKAILLIALAILLCSLPTMAARSTVVPVVHSTNIVYQAYTFPSPVTAVGIPPILAVSGVLSFSPAALVQSAVGQRRITIKSVVLQKQTPQIIQCAEVFPAHTVSQQGAANVRLTWPLMYEAPGTTWTLTIVYGTWAAYDDDGPGPNPAGYVHTAVWKWRVEATFGSMKDLLVLFHQLPFGTSETPLISDEVLYSALQAKLAAIEAALAGPVPDNVTAGLILGDFEMEVMDACIGVPPTKPAPTGPGTGIANTVENPACCKLLVDAEHVGWELGMAPP